MNKTTYRDDTIRNVLLLVAMVVIGAVMLVFPNESELALRIISSVILIVYGAIQIVNYAKKKETIAPFSPGSLATGLTLIFLGAFLMFFRNGLHDILSVALSFILVYAGFSCLQTAIELKRRGAAKWYFSLILAVLSVACGAVALLAGFSDETLISFMGIAFCAEGALMIVNLILFYKKLKDQPHPVATASQPIAPTVPVPPADPVVPVEPEK